MHFPEQRKILLENDVSVQLKSSEIVVRIGDEVDDQIKFRRNLARRGNELKLVLRPTTQRQRMPTQCCLSLSRMPSLAQQAAACPVPRTHSCPTTANGICGSFFG